MNPRRLILLAALLVAVPHFPAVHAEDPPAEPPAGPPDVPPDVPPAEPPPPPEDPERAQRMADAAAKDAFALIEKGDITNVMEGLHQLSRQKSSVLTAQVVNFALQRSELHVAEFAGFALARSDPDGALAELERRLDSDGDSAERVQAAGMLGALPAPRSVAMLARQDMLRSRNTTVVRETLRSLGRHRAKEGLDVAIHALGAKDADLRNVACVALGRIGDPKASAPLLGKLDDNDGGTDGFAAIALGRLEDDGIFANLAARLASGNREAKGKALVAAARPAHKDRLLALIGSGSDDARIAACAALGKLALHDMDVQQGLLSALLDTSDRWVSAAAFHALGRCATAELAPSLAKRMGQRDERKLFYVMEIAGDIRCKEALKTITHVMWTEDNDVLRRTAMNAFWRILDPAAIEDAEAKIRAAKGKSVERAAELLGRRRNMNGFHLALELMDELRDGSREERWVEGALEWQTGHFFGPDTSIWREWFEKNPQFFEKEQATIEREKWREDFLAENKGPRVTPRTEIAVQMALDYLARHQSPSGAFDQQHFLDLCEEKDKCTRGAGARVQMDPVGISALCSLAYYAAGCNADSGRYAGVLARVNEYMLSRQMPNGDYKPNDLIGGYNRPLALQAYAEAYAASHDPELLPFIQRGVDFIACIQSDKGGWRYRVVDNANDTSVVSWVLFGAKSAEKAGAHVRTSIYEGCDLVLWGDQTHPTTEREDFVRDIDPNYEFEVGLNTQYTFHTGYQDSAFQKNQACTALGMMSRILLGYRRSHPFCIGSANKILEDQLPELPKREGRWDGYILDRQYPMYFLYYGTLAMHQMGGRYFREWNQRVKEILPATQEQSGCERGSWASWNIDGLFSRLYITAMGALTLETYYRYAPILQD